MVFCYTFAKAVKTQFPTRKLLCVVVCSATAKKPSSFFSLKTVLHCQVSTTSPQSRNNFYLFLWSTHAEPITFHVAPQSNRSSDGDSGILQIRESVQLPASQERVLPPLQGNQKKKTCLVVRLAVLVISFCLSSFPAILIVKNPSHCQLNCVLMFFSIPLWFQRTPPHCWTGDSKKCIIPLSYFWYYFPSRNFFGEKNASPKSFSLFCCEIAKIWTVRRTEL